MKTKTKMALLTAASQAFSKGRRYNLSICK